MKVHSFVQALYNEADTLLVGKVIELDEDVVVVEDYRYRGVMCKEGCKLFSRKEFDNCTWTTSRHSIKSVLKMPKLHRLSSRRYTYFFEELQDVDFQKKGQDVSRLKGCSLAPFKEAAP